MTKKTDTLEYIKTAGSCDLAEILRAVQARYRVLFPEEEVVFLSLPLRNSEERTEILRRALELLARA